MSGVFISYVRDNGEDVQRLANTLKGHGVEVWLDREQIKPGYRWKDAIREAIAQGDFFIACFSAESTSRSRTYMHEELTLAVEELRQRPTDRAWFIPVLLSKGEVPDRSIGAGETLRSIQWVALYENWDAGIRRILSVIQPTPQRLLFEPEMIRIPAGKFLMGSDPEKDKYASTDEVFQHTVYLPEYYLAKTPVTNAEYAAFLQEADYKPSTRWQYQDGNPPRGKEDHPAVEVTWHDAMAYCHWLSEVTGKSYDLPSEAEWEKGARGTDGRIYPWGNQWEPTRCNTTNFNRIGPDTRDTTPVHAYPGGASPYGVLDMSGNVWEWTRSLSKKNPGGAYLSYPYNPSDGQENREAPENMTRVRRGGNFKGDRETARCAYRFWSDLSGRVASSGFRVVLLP